MRVARNVILLGVLLGLPGPVLAQAGQPSEAPPTDVSRQNGTLSDKLSTTGGVIHPDGGSDGSIEKAPSTESRMPVIPPAGSAGAGGVAK
ncbi:hypothetical protein P7D22_08450 [Lichenihabitans sp. Uapishka_5]|uniref:hypothetical protein n=1 Tax=Lichenihabitans sp. Uapishka_5 TaxID=3037302 RepID=UPI0029E80585|nr:hypothetical protein [Lichenihabitans sp. Uapishka_5]MDX7951206.1 hypothetical protein [Lichenihabitans sp. Uapishka_5]